MCKNKKDKGKRIEKNVKMGRAKIETELDSKVKKKVSSETQNKMGKAEEEIFDID